MSDHDGPVIVIGSGLAGYTAIRQLRELQKERPITLVTADGGEFYSKPMLSNALAKQQTPDTLVQKTAEARAAELNIRVLTRCRAGRIDPVARKVFTDQGVLAYQALVLATGAQQRVIAPAGAKPDWIHTVNSLDDFRVWHRRLQGVSRVLLIGAGLIGCEFADDLLSHGVAVVLVDLAPWPLPRLLPQQLGDALAGALRARGAHLHLGCTIATLERREQGDYLARLGDGATVHAELVLSATGLVPNVALAKTAGLRCEQGIVVDRQLRSSDPHIYAIGDCAQTSAGPLPYIMPIMAQGRCLAQVLAGQDTQLSMKAMPVLVKTTSLPLVVCPPRAGAPGVWTVEGEGRDLAAVFHGPDGAALGFAVSGKALAQKNALTKLMPSLVGD
ncbi:MAG: FAD-dependent oxidoreductase [Gammaproteobacteria bacterium]